MYLDSKLDYQLTLTISKKYTRILGLFCILSFVICAAKTVSYRLKCDSRGTYYSYGCVLEQKFLHIWVFNTPLGLIDSAEIKYIAKKSARIRSRDYYQLYLNLANGNTYPLQIWTYTAGEASLLASEINYYLHYKQQDIFIFPYAKDQQFRIYFFSILSLLFLIGGLILGFKRNMKVTFDKNKNWIKLRSANFYVPTKTIPFMQVKEITTTRKNGVEYVVIILRDNSSINIKDEWSNSFHENEYVVAKINQFLWQKSS